MLSVHMFSSKLLLKVVGAFLILFVTLIYTQIHLSHKNNNIRFNDMEMGFLKSRNYNMLWRTINSLMKEDTLYPENFNVGFVLDALRSAKIIKAGMFDKQTSFKMMFLLEGGAKAIFKPQLIPKEQKFEQCNEGCEHAEYEVAGFAVNRILNLRNMPFVTGRVVSWHNEIAPVATPELLQKLNQKDSKICIRQRCLTDTPKLKIMANKCFDQGLIPGVLIYFIPFDTEWPEKYIEYSPWLIKKRRPGMTASLLPGDTAYCKEFRKDDMYKQDKWFADLTDLGVADFMMSHVDSRHFYIIGDNGNPLMNVVLDYGRAFCPVPFKSPIELLAPITQCCKIRKKVYKSLLQHKDDFAEKFDQLTKDDPLYPVLDYDLLFPIKSRIRQILAQVEYCIAATNITDVLMDL